MLLVAAACVNTQCLLKKYCDTKYMLFCVILQPILESGVIELLCSLTQSDSPALRVNGIWALMVSRRFYLDRHTVLNYHLKLYLIFT